MADVFHGALSAVKLWRGSIVLWSRSQGIRFNCVFLWNRSTSSSTCQHYLTEVLICFILFFFPFLFYFFSKLKVSKCEVQPFKHVKARGDEWDARENECLCMELAGVLCMITEVMCHGLGQGNKLKTQSRIQNFKLFPYCKFSRVLVNSSIKHAEGLDCFVTLWWLEKSELSWENYNWDN